MEERFRFIEECRADEWSFAELCRRYGVSRKTGYKWLARYQEHGLQGLQDQSRAPEHRPNEVIDEVIQAVLDMRRAYPLWGPLKLRHRLQRQAPEVKWPAVSTIGELLKRAGLTVPRKRRARATPNHSPLSHATCANRVWSADYKGCFWCADGERCDPLTITDGFSRYLLRCQAMTGMDEASTQAVMEAAFREYGLPEAIRSDNGEPFGGVGLGGLTRLSVWWVQLGIRPERIPPAKPQQNGRHERMHRTLKQATARPPAAHMRAQQKAFDRFREEYNWERPHQALEMQTPAELYVPSERSYPSRLAEPVYASDWHVRSVGPCGTMRWANEKIFVGKALAGQRLGLEPIADGQWKLWLYDYALGIVDERTGKVQKLKAGPKLSSVVATENACGSKEL